MSKKKNKQLNNNEINKIKLLNLKGVFTQKKRFIIITFIIVLFSVALFVMKEWLYSECGGLTFNEIIFHINVPLKGTNQNTIRDFFTRPFPQIIGLTILLSYLILRIFRNSRKTIVASLLIMILSVSYVAKTAKIIDYIKSQMTASTFFEENYVDPRTVEIKAPEKKRNLIYLYLESMETSYLSKEQGGNSDYCMIPELYKLAEDNVSFSMGDKYQGGLATYGTTWTTGAMAGHSGGVPLNFSVPFLQENVNDYSYYEDFLPGLYNIGDFLNDQGYNQMFLCGSNVSFGGRKNLFTQHGNFRVYGFEEAVADGRKAEEDRVFWGFDDLDLFAYAKEFLTELGNEDKPFNFTFLTVDTHFPGGYECPFCKPATEGKYRYKDVMECSSRQISWFIEWCKIQPWYENTTIVIAGDHLTMDIILGDEMNRGNYERGVYNCIINGAVNIAKEDTKNKRFTTFDFFPTTLAAMGYEIEGNRLALGTNLYSNEPTLLQRYSIDYINEELQKVSTFYNKNILYRSKE